MDTEAHTEDMEALVAVATTTEARTEDLGEDLAIIAVGPGDITATLAMAHIITMVLDWRPSSWEDSLRLPVEQSFIL